MDYDAIVIGGGPAGLSAGTELAQARRRVLLLEKESFGGPVINLEWIHGYPRPGEKIPGAKLASDFVARAEQAGVEMELAEAIELAAYSGCLSVTCADGRAYTSSVVIHAGGLHSKALGIPGEDRFQGKGMIHCAMCDAGLYRDKVVAVCGGGNAGLLEAMYLARFATKVRVIEAQSALSARPALQERARADPKLEFRLGEKPVAILGNGGVSAVLVENQATGQREQVDAYGVLVHVGYAPTTAYLEGVLALDDSGYILVNDRFEADVPGTFAAGDIRSGAPRQVAAAVADGKAAAAGALKFLESLKPHG
ncbi:MAG TPA: FAD-dependent oxidoreductase [Burkholderiales bacterium]|nr:FAD-dependent oxidoreductase [Burkholderiales bacterium]